MYTRNEELAKQKGYYVNEEGVAFSPRGHIVGTCGNITYLYFGIRKDKKTVLKIFIHRLQAYQKYSEKIHEAGIEVRHLDGNRQNNSYRNIEIGSHIENMNDVPKEVRRNKAIYASSKVKSLRRFSDEEVIEMRRLHREGISYTKLMKMYNVTSKSTIGFLINKKIIAG